MFYRIHNILLLFPVVLTRGGGPECGIMPAKVYLGKGEKTQIIFWTDQNNTNVSSTTEQSTTQQSVDVFLQAVNGQISISKGSESAPAPMFAQSSTPPSLTPASPGVTTPESLLIFPDELESLSDFETTTRDETQMGSIDFTVIPHHETTTLAYSSGSSGTTANFTPHSSTNEEVEESEEVLEEANKDVIPVEEDESVQEIDEIEEEEESEGIEEAEEDDEIKQAEIEKVEEEIIKVAEVEEVNAADKVSEVLPAEESATDYVELMQPVHVITAEAATSTEQTTAEQTTVEQTTTEQTTEVQTTTEQTTAEQTASEHTTAEQTASEQTTAEQTTPEQTTAKQKTSEHTIAEQTIAEQTTEKQTTDVQTMPTPAQTTAGKTTPQQTTVDLKNKLSTEKQTTIESKGSMETTVEETTSSLSVTPSLTTPLQASSSLSSENSAAANNSTTEEPKSVSESDSEISGTEQITEALEKETLVNHSEIKIEEEATSSEEASSDAIKVKEVASTSTVRTDIMEDDISYSEEYTTVAGIEDKTQSTEYLFDSETEPSLNTQTDNSEQAIQSTTILSSESRTEISQELIESFEVDNEDTITESTQTETTNLKKEYFSTVEKSTENNLEEEFMSGESEIPDVNPTIEGSGDASETLNDDVDDIDEYSIDIDWNKEFDETTTGTPEAVTNSEINIEDVTLSGQILLQVEPVVAEEENYDDNPYVTYYPISQDIEFDQTTIKSYSDEFIVTIPADFENKIDSSDLDKENSENKDVAGEILPLEVEAVVAEEEQTMFDYTTTGSPFQIPNIPELVDLEISAVVADVDEDNDNSNTFESTQLSNGFIISSLFPEQNKIYQDTTTGHPVKLPMGSDLALSTDNEISQAPIYDDDIDYTTYFKDISNTENPYDTTNEIETETSLIQEELLNDITARKVEDTNTSEDIAADKNVIDADIVTVKTTTKQALDETTFKTSLKESTVTKVEANKVNGPLYLDTIKYVNPDATSNVSQILEESTQPMPAQGTTQGDGITFPEEVEIESSNEVITDLVEGFKTEDDSSNDIFSDLNEVGPTSLTTEVTTPRPATTSTDIPNISTTTLATATSADVPEISTTSADVPDISSTTLPSTTSTDIPEISTTTLPLTTVINGFILPQYNFKKKNLVNSINDNIESVRTSSNTESRKDTTWVPEGADTTDTADTTGTTEADDDLAMTEKVKINDIEESTDESKLVATVTTDASKLLDLTTNESIDSTESAVDTNLKTKHFRLVRSTPSFTDDATVFTTNPSTAVTDEPTESESVTDFVISEQDATTTELFRNTEIFEVDETTLESTVTPASDDGTTLNPEIEIDASSEIIDITSTPSTDSLMDRSDVDVVEMVEKKPPSPFPVSDLLSGIYRLIQGYMPGKKEGVPARSGIERVDIVDYPQDLEYFDSPQVQPLTNVHNAPRQSYQEETPQLNQEESVDVSNSHTDPFVQLSAPDLTGLLPAGEREEGVSYIFPTRTQTDPPQTLSPFNSPALRVEEPPKVLIKEEEEKEKKKEKINNFGNLNPFKSILPSFFYANQDAGAQVAGALPVSVQEPNRRPVHDVRSSVQSSQIAIPATRRPIFGNLFQTGSLFSKDQTEQVLQKRPRGEPVSIQLSADDEIERLNLEERFNQGRTITGFTAARTNQDLGEEEGSLRQPRELNSMFDPVESLRNPDHHLFRFLDSQPLPLKRGLLDPRQRMKREADSVSCTWTIETEKNLYLLVTFHNLSAPYTVQCSGAYIEVEREKNGFEARWCGNRVTQGGSRPHVIFARSEVRITVFDDGSEGKSLPTGFNADVEVIDLFDARQYSSLRKSNAYSNVRKLTG